MWPVEELDCGPLGDAELADDRADLGLIAHEDHVMAGRAGVSQGSLDDHFRPVIPSHGVDGDADRTFHQVVIESLGRDDRAEWTTLIVTAGVADTVG